MKRFLGLPIIRETLTDAQYVERVRQGLRNSKRYGKWIVISMAALLIVWAYVLHWAICAVESVFANPAVGGLGLGIVFGAGFTVMAFHLVELFRNSIESLNGDRSQRLLVEYHESLAAVVEFQQATEASFLDSGAGEGKGPR